MLERFRDRLKPIFNWIAKYFKWLHPNVLTIIGSILGLIPAYFYIKGNALVGGLTLIVLIFDSIDGAVARITGKKSSFGEVLDSSLDRIVDGLIIFSIAGGGFVSFELASVVLVGTYLVSYIRARTEAASGKAFKMNIGLAQRGDRIIILMIASIVYFDKIHIAALTFNSLEIAFLLLATLTWLTVVQRLWVTYRSLTTKK